MFLASKQPSYFRITGKPDACLLFQCRLHMTVYEEYNIAESIPWRDVPEVPLHTLPRLLLGERMILSQMLQGQRSPCSSDPFLWSNFVTNRSSLNSPLDNSPNIPERKFLPISQSPIVGPMVAGSSMLTMPAMAATEAVAREFGGERVNDCKRK